MGNEKQVKEMKCFERGRDTEYITKEKPELLHSFM